MLIVTALIVIPGVFGVEALPLTCILFILTVVFTSYFVITILMKILGKASVFSMTDEVKHEPEIELPKQEIKEAAIEVTVDKTATETAAGRKRS